MRFNKLDLNLLVVLDMLLTERNVSRAGDRLNLSQSATSGALARLREHFRDELLVPVGRQMMPTARALELAPAVRVILVQIESRILATSSFDPATSRRHIRIMASDYVTIVWLSDALARIAMLAPELSFEIIQVDNEPAEAIDNGRIDFLIIPQRYVSKTQPSEIVFSDSYVCVVCENNADVGETIDFEHYMRMPHVVVQFASLRRPAFEDLFIDRFGNTRHVDVIASTYGVVPFFISGTRRIAVMHRMLAERYAGRFGLRMLVPPLDIPDIVEMIQWHGVVTNDDALMWVKAQLLAGATPIALVDT